MRNMAKPPIREINQINDLIINEPSKIIIEAEDRYSKQIKTNAIYGTGADVENFECHPGNTPNLAKVTFAS